MTDLSMRVAEAVAQAILKDLEDFGQYQKKIAGDASSHWQDIAGAEASANAVDDCKTFVTELDLAAIVASVTAESEQQPVAYLCADSETGKILWGESCVCEDPIFNDEVNNPGCFSLPVYTHPQPAIPPGWKMVPMELSVEQCRAVEKRAGVNLIRGWPPLNFNGMYRIAIAAAPEYKEE